MNQGVCQVANNKINIFASRNLVKIDPQDTEPADQYEARENVSEYIKKVVGTTSRQLGQFGVGIPELSQGVATAVCGPILPTTTRSVVAGEIVPSIIIGIRVGNKNGSQIVTKGVGSPSSPVKHRDRRPDGWRNEILQTGVGPRSV